MTIAAGRLPAASRLSTSQSIDPRAPCTQPPKPLVIAAKSRSVPIAVCGATPKRKTSSGVISAPPPTPVNPTSTPTRKPARGLSRSMASRVPW